MITDRERVLKSLKWEQPHSLIVESGFSPATWKKYREALEPVSARMANDFNVYSGPRKDYDQMPPTYRKDDVFTDAWGCVWECRVDGMEGIIKHHPLADRWAGFESYHLPDPLKTADKVPWDQQAFEHELKKNVNAHKYIMGGGDRFWERIHFLRGYENTMIDLAEGEPRLIKLIERVIEYNLRSIQKFLQYDEVDCIVFGDDWGEQNRLMISPRTWREYFFSGYQAMFQAVKRADRAVYFHTDGYLMPIVPDLIEAGADIINLQYRPNGIHNIREACLNNVCVSVDIDRQHFMPWGTPGEVKDHIREIYTVMEGWNGGLWVKMDVYPDTPLENIIAMCEVFEELRMIV
jgi:uroporphyrinogen decarboxylase